MKPLTFSVLRLLSDSGFRSGEEMARQLGVSRATVWNAMQELEQAGILSFKVRGRGYRLSEPLTWLCRESVLSALAGKSALFDLEIHDVLESTNTALLQKAALGARHGSCVAAELQTGGRGRRGRTWHAGLGGGLTFSLLWRFDQGAGSLSGLSLAVGVALLRALREAGVADALLKWPNDVLHQYRKLAGILIELQGDMLGPSVAVIGIGLNLRLPEKVRGQIGQAVADMHGISGRVPDRNRMLAGLLSHLADVLQEFEAQGFAALRQEWLASHAYQGKAVRLSLPDGSLREGRLLGVAEDGALLLQTGAGRQRFTCGDISLRGAP